ncbi:MAG: hypothetical protein HC884_06550 [Chloroflexaceae bacterium]|nr:hypothetical protein [Chloroflexaceae bacterium]
MTIRVCDGVWLKRGGEDGDSIYVEPTYVGHTNAFARIYEAINVRRDDPDVDKDEAAPALIPVEPVAALEEVLDQFYQAGAGIDTITVELSPPAVDAPMLRQMGPPPAGTDRALREVYAAMTAAVRERVFGEGDASG